MTRRRLFRQRLEIALIAGLAAFGSASRATAVETLATSRTLNSGGAATSSQTFVNLATVTNAASATGDVMLLASLAANPGGGPGPRAGEWRLVSGAQQSTPLRREMSDSSNDFGIVNLAWQFTALAPGAGVTLQHRTTNGRSIRTEDITLVMIPMTTQPAATVLNHAAAPQGAFSFSTASSSFVPVEGPGGVELLATVSAPPVTVQRAIFVAAVLSTSTPGANPATGRWKLQYNSAASPPATPCQGGIDVGTEVQRSLSGGADVGAVTLYAIAENLEAGSYQFRLCAASGTVGESIASTNASLVAFSLAFVGGGAGGHFPHIQQSVAQTQTSSGSMAALPNLLESFTLDATSNVFLAMSFTAFTTTSGTGDFGEFETCIQSGAGSYPFGRDQNGTSQEVRRFFSRASDRGAGGQVGLALNLAPGSGPFSARGCASVTGNPVTLLLPNLVGFVPRSRDDATVPVSLAWFRATAADRLILEWSTSTEVANVGFNLYQLDAGQLRRLNRDLIPSRSSDSVTPVFYRYETAAAGGGGSLFLEDIDIHGRSTFRGPFAAGEEYGRQAPDPRPTPWAELRRAQAASRADRAAADRSRRVAVVPRPRSKAFDEARLEVDRDGIYRVTYEQLLAAGVDWRGAALDRLALSSRGESVPLRVVGTGDFGPDAFVEFVGQSLDTLYTRTNVYNLGVDRLAATRVRDDLRPPDPRARVPHFYLEKARVEVNRAYHFAAPGDDPWYDARLLATSGPVEMAVDLDLPGLWPGAAPVELELSLWGVTDYPESPDHHVIVEVNGVQVADEWFNGLADHPIRLQLPAALVGERWNRLLLRLPHDTGASVDLVHYDHYRVSYPRRFRARDGRLRFEAGDESFRVDGLPPGEVVVYRVSESGTEFLRQVRTRPARRGQAASFAGSDHPATYWVSTADRLLTPRIEPAPPAADLPRGEARLLIISHPDFVAGVEPLVWARRAAGYSVEVVDVDTVYRRFGHGVFDPQAIRTFVKLARERMGTEYVLLVGGDTYDYHGYLGTGAVSFIPTLYARTGPIVHFAPVDPLYADVDDDGVPDLAIGRWPVRHPDELRALVDKTLDYEAMGRTRSAVVAADAFDLFSNTSFGEISDGLIARLTDGWSVNRAYIDEEGVDGARRILIDGIDRGVALTSYFGHSGPSVWSFRGLFSTEDAERLANWRRPTVVAQWGCWNTYYVSPTYDTLAHALLLSGERGASAVLGATTLTQTASEQALGAYFFAALGGKQTTLGAALQQAKRELAKTQPELTDVILGWTLLGDPTLVIEP